MEPVALDKTFNLCLDYLLFLPENKIRIQDNDSPCVFLLEGFGQGSAKIDYGFLTGGTEDIVIFQYHKEKLFFEASDL
jgi:hypothetical protein